MEGGSVRDRIRAAELARQQAEAGSSSPISPRRGFKIALKSDEHVKEEFLKRGDGGWTKNVNIGQMTPFAIPKTVPAIQVTKVGAPVAEKRVPLPGKITVPGAFETNDVLQDDPVPFTKAKKSVPKTVEPVPEAEEAPLIEITPSKTAEPASRPPRIQIPSASTSRSMTFDVGENSKKRVKGRSRSREPPAAASSKHRISAITKKSRELVDDEDEVKSELREDRQAKKGNQRPPRPASKREERLSVHYTDDDEEQYTARSRSPSRSRHSEEVATEESADEPADEPADESPRNHRRLSPHSHKHPSDEHLTAADIPQRRSSHSLWPSFSRSGRRSTTGLTEGMPKPRSKSTHSTTNPDDHSIAEKPPHSPRKEIGFMEYVSGKKLDHLPDATMRPKPSERMGYVRSKSSTGRYSEHFTRDKRLLRKPDEDEFLEYSDYDRQRKSRHGSWHDVAHQRKDEPWQVKLARGLVKR
ncbi:hypothetical protein H2198_009414 [Neophaeococcomyces mojaviensis]|uniref:Uncharacterized protein n=1 Tax=Neophaeococcomyces mojaviensis TaxID=3383035 RepID=A0ACC2ZUU5_9EURO|nr:hypothetical protein H2198_009414 [Knufia sp. JES_112]